MDQKHQKNIKYTNRLLILTALIVSFAVTAFAVICIINTDHLALYVKNIYQNTYQVTSNARNLHSDLLEKRVAMDSLIEDPTSKQSQYSLAEFYRSRAVVVGNIKVMEDYLGTEKTAELRQAYDELRQIHDEIIVLALAGKKQEARQLLEQKADPLYDKAKEITQNMIRAGAQEIDEYVKEAEVINENTNRVALILGGMVIALSVGTSVLSARAIRRRNNEIYHNEILFHIIAENVDEVFEVYDMEERKVEFASRNMERILGKKAEAYMESNKVFDPYVSEEGKVMLRSAYFDRNLKRVAEFEYQFISPKTGQPRRMHTKIYPIWGKNGEVIKQITMTHDVTEDKAAQEKLRQALRDAEFANASKREFLSRMSHEIRTPINAIIGMESLAERVLDDPVKLKSYLNNINVASRHLLGLVNDVLDMSKIESGKLRLEYSAFHIDALIGNVTSLICERATEKKQKLTVNMDDVPWKNLVGDELRLRQVLLNFLTNAIKFTPEEGEIQLTVSQNQAEDEFVTTRFAVADNGMGIAPEFMERIFDSFEQQDVSTSRKFGGTGLGMSISKRLIDQMGGKVWFKSEEGKGSEFSFEVRLELAKACLEREGEEKTQSSFFGLRVLVAEDNEINREIARELLLVAGFEVEEACDGKEAVERFCAADADYFDLILMDVQMPVMDGYEAARHIRASKKGNAADIAIVAMTADVFEEAEKAALSAGMTGYLSKPVDPQVMLDRLKELLGSQKKKEREDGKKA